MFIPLYALIPAVVVSLVSICIIAVLGREWSLLQAEVEKLREGSE